MKKIIDVSTGEVKISSGRTMLRAIAIGSCVVIAAYDSTKKTAAMAHIMLPGTAPAKGGLGKTKYAAEAIDLLLKQMAAAGSAIVDIEACLVGAGNVLQKDDDTICKDNIKSATQLLKEKGVAVRAAVLGGTQRKGVFLDAESGRISYTEGDKGEKLLWQPNASRGTSITIAGSVSGLEDGEGE